MPHGKLRDWTSQLGGIGSSLRFLLSFYKRPLLNKRKEVERSCEMIWIRWLGSQKKSFELEARFAFHPSSSGMCGRLLFSFPTLLSPVQRQIIDGRVFFLRPYLNSLFVPSIPNTARSSPVSSYKLFAGTSQTQTELLL